MFSRNDGVVERVVANQLILMPLANSIADMGCVFVFNKVGSFIWARLEQPSTTDQLVDAVIDRFAVDRLTGVKDVEHFLGQLVEADLVCRS